MRIPLLATLAFLAASASADAQDNTPKPVPGIPVQSWTVDVFHPLARDIYLRNDDSVARIIVDVQIYNCENMKQVCQVYTPNLLLPAGKTVKAMRLTPDRTTLPWKYAFTFHSKSAVPPAMPQMITTSMSSFSRTGPLPYVGLGNIETFHPRIATATDQASCSRNSQTQGPAGGPTLVMYVSGKGSDDATMVYLDLDAQNNPVLYTEVRGSMRGPPGEPGAEARPAYTIISIRVARQIAELVNEGGNQPSEFFTAAGPDLMTATSLGKPGEKMARVLKECGAK